MPEAPVPRCVGVVEAIVSPDVCRGCRSPLSPISVGFRRPPFPRMCVGCRSPLSPEILGFEAPLSLEMKGVGGPSFQMCWGVEATLPRCMKGVEASLFLDVFEGFRRPLSPDVCWGCRCPPEICVGCRRPLCPVLCGRRRSPPPPRSVWDVERSCPHM